MIVGLSEQEQTSLSGVLRFAQTLEPKLKDGDWLNAFEDALRVIGGGEVSLARKLVPGLTYPLTVVQSKAWLTPVREPIKELTERLFGAQDGPEAPVNLSRAVGIEFEGKCFYKVLAGQFRVIYQPRRKEPVEGFREGLLLSIGDRISRLAQGQLRLCPECGKVFVGLGKQRFDTPECSGRFRVRQFRKEKADERATQKKKRQRVGKRER